MKDFNSVRLLPVALTLTLLWSPSNGTLSSATQECPIEITPNWMLIKSSGLNLTAACRPTPDGARNVKEIYWELQGGIRIYNESLNLAHDRPDHEWNSQPICKGTFLGIGTCSKALNLTVYRLPSVFIDHAQDSNAWIEGGELQLQCHIFNVAPVWALRVLWYLGNDTIERQTPGEVGTCLHSTNTKCTGLAKVSSNFTITADRKHSDGEFRCEAQLDLGPDGPQPPPSVKSDPLNITVLYKPVINATKLPRIIPVFHGYPEELVCEAEGFPLPTITWHYGPAKVLRVSENTLTVSEAGLYTCIATNVVDSTSHEVQVILKEDYLPLIAGFVAVTVIVISIIFCFIYSIYYKNTRMRRYSLKNPKLSTHNGNVAHNGWDLQFPMTKLS